MRKGREASHTGENVILPRERDSECEGLNERHLKKEVREGGEGKERKEGRVVGRGRM
jgi:hypothetical protein